MSKVVENYIIMEEVGKGQYSQVHKGRHIGTGEMVAVKIIKLDAINENPEIQDLISEELQALRTLESPYIVKHLRYLRTTNNMYEVYQFYQDGDLNELLTKEGALPLQKSLKIFKDLVKAIKVLYENCVIHRDIKPENIFMEDGRAILGDFGFCKLLKNNLELVEGAFGSPMYMSPESLRNQRYGLKSDLYSLGVSD